MDQDLNCLVKIFLQWLSNAIEIMSPCLSLGHHKGKYFYTLMYNFNFLVNETSSS